MIQFLVVSENAGGAAGGSVSCGGTGVLSVLRFISRLLDYVFIIVPILLIIMISIDFARNVIASNEDNMRKNLNLVIKRIIMCVALFLVPTIVSAFNSLLGNLGVDYSTCWKIAEGNGDLSQYAIDYPISETDPKSIDLVGGKQVVSPGSDSSDSDSSDSDDNSSSDSTDIDDASSDDTNNSGNSNNDSKSSVTKGTINIFIGDSRTCGMRDSLGSLSNSSDIWICKDGAGYGWFSSDGMAKLRSSIVRGKKYRIFLNMGVNDLDSIGNYINKYKEIANSYTNSKVIAVSVNPVDEALEANYGYKVKNANIQQFNRELSKSISGTNLSYCNTYSKITFKTVNDGLHYTGQTYKTLYQAILKCS